MATPRRHPAPPCTTRVDPQAGTIRANGVEITDLPAEIWRTNLTLVPQRPHLFHGSVIENIRLARPDAGQAEIEPDRVIRPEVADARDDTLRDQPVWCVIHVQGGVGPDRREIDQQGTTLDRAGDAVRAEHDLLDRIGVEQA